MTDPRASGPDQAQALRRKLQLTRVALIDERSLLGETPLAKAFQKQIRELEAELARLVPRGSS